MKRLAVIGHPISHSLSPRIHSAFGRQVGIELDYQTIDIGPQDLKAFLDGDGREYVGLNVTLPHKEGALAHAGVLTERARAAGAVNTLIRQDVGWLGDNTDGVGLIRDLARQRFPLARTHVVLLGAGGAARGIIPLLLASGVSKVSIVNRTVERAQVLASSFGPSVIAGVHAVPIDGILHTTALGHSGECPRMEQQWFTATPWCYDISYGKAARPFLENVKGRGVHTASDGLGMLIEQAAESFFKWLGVRPDTHAVHATLSPKNA